MATLEVRPAWSYHFNRLRCGNAYHLREVSLARTQRLVREARDYVSDIVCPRRQGLRVQVPRSLFLAGIEPVGFRVKSDLRNHCAIVQPRDGATLLVPVAK